MGQGGGAKKGTQRLGNENGLLTLRMETAEARCLPLTGCVLRPARTSLHTTEEIVRTMKHLRCLICCLLSACWLSAAACYGATPRQKTVRVACVGNSVTYGYGIPGRDSLSYPAQLGRLLGPQFEVRNFGHSGATLLRRGHRPYMQVEEFRAALAFRPDWIIVHLGLNDTDPRNWPQYGDDFVRDYCALIDSFRAVNPAVRVWVCRLTPIFHGHRRFASGTRDWHAEIQARMPQVAAATGAQLIDLYTPLHCRPDLFPDYLHPNAAGAAILAETVRRALTGDYGGLQLAPWLTDGAVLRRNRPVRIVGTANAGESVQVRFRGEQQRVRAADDGHWQVTFAAGAAGGPYELCAEAPSGKITVRNLWLGEVWLCSGQSNMELPLREARTAAEDVRAADTLRRLHLYQMTTLGIPYAEVWDSLRMDSIDRLLYFRPARWESCSSAAAARFSAIGYHFGRILSDSLQCPVGIICNAVGGATTESWIDRTTLETEYPPILQNWMENDHIMAWARERARYNLQRSTSAAPRHPYEPCYLFETGMAPLAGLDLSGVLWYQGESNADRPEMHERLFPWLEQSWRTFFGREDLPFYFVQLSGLSTRPAWPRFRDGQRRLADYLPHTFMVVSSDVGDSLNVHPAAKREVGERLARAALCHTYGRRLTPCGPLFRTLERRDGALCVRFRYAEGLHGAQGASIRGFEIAGADGRYFPAEVRVMAGGAAGDALLLSSPQVPLPCLVRYAWEPFPHANLVNADDLPASTFRAALAE